MSLINQLALLTLDPTIYSKESYLYFYAAFVFLSPAMVKLLISIFLFCNTTVLTVCNEKANHTLSVSICLLTFVQKKELLENKHALKEYYSSVKLN